MINKYLFIHKENINSSCSSCHRDNLKAMTEQGKLELLLLYLSMLYFNRESNYIIARVK